jgi:exodeoxyribonuclease VII large subunit
VVFLTLRDPSEDVSLAVTCFRAVFDPVADLVSEGSRVVVHAKPEWYGPRGTLSLRAAEIRLVGLGDLLARLELLKRTLGAEGLFAAERKRPLPSLPRRIGVITSPTGAAVRDILHVLARRFPAAAVLIYPVSVQGAQAAGEIVAALESAGVRAECDVLILARGGGSLEDLWAFNDERLARAIVASPIPVITGIGHEIDFTIADFAADVRAPTPSAAAELVVPDAQEWLDAFTQFAARLQRCMRRRIEERRERLRWLTGRAALVSPAARLGAQAQRLDELEQCLVRAMRRRLQEQGERLRWLSGRASLVSPSARLKLQLSRLESLDQRLGRAWRQAMSSRREKLLPLIRTLQAVSPLATLERGYAIVSLEGGDILRDAADAKPGAIIEARLARGRVRAKVEEAS